MGRNSPHRPGEDRRRDIDWLRAGAVYLLLLFHSARPFDSGDWHVKDGPPALAVDLLNGAIKHAHMPLLFTLAGWSLVRSLERRDTRSLLRERRDRLLVPLAVGCAVLIPPCAYIEARHKDETEAGFLEYLPSFFTSLDEFTWMHLWFLIYLYVFTLLWLPALRRVNAWHGRIERVPSWAIYAAILPFAAVQVGLRGRWPGYQNLYDDWANFAYYSLFFVAGFLLARFPAIERAVHDERRRAACAGAVAVAVAGLLSPRAGFDLAAGSAAWIGYEAATAVAGTCLVIAALGYAHALLAARERGLAFARESAMPVYVLHQPIIIALAAPVVALPAGVAVKLALLLTGSSALTVGAYLLARRSDTLLRLLGARAAAPSRSGAASRSSGRAARSRGLLPRAMTRTRRCRGSGPAA